MHNNEPKGDVLHHWKIALPREMARLSLNEFFEQWPILKTQAANDLIMLFFSSQT